MQTLSNSQNIYKITLGILNFFPFLPFSGAKKQYACDVSHLTPFFQQISSENLSQFSLWIGGIIFVSFFSFLERFSRLTTYKKNLKQFLR